jgi:maleylacetoacetate isomerase/maleylpyruvate isomerase
LKLYSYFRSSAAFRVRIALGLKGLAFETVPVHLQKNEQQGAAYAEVSTSGLVPTLVDGETTLTQSLAILEYLEETHPEPPLLPRDAAGRARVRAIALDIACEIHPIDNLRVLRYLVREMGVAEADKDRWYKHWVETGLEAVERRLADGGTGRFCHGDTPTLADCTLVPQIFNAQRFGCRTEHVPTVMRVFAACMELEAFRAAEPARQPDAE